MNAFTHLSMNAYLCVYSITFNKPVLNWLDTTNRLLAQQALLRQQRETRWLLDEILQLFSRARVESL